MRTIIDVRRPIQIATFLALFMAMSVTSFPQAKTAKDHKMTKKNSEAVWKLQGQSVSDEFGLSSDKAAKLSDAYLAARKSHKQTLKEMPAEKNKDRSRAMIQDAIEKDRAKFMSALKGSLSEDLIAKVIPTLGSFNSKFDSYTIALLDLKLDNAAMKSAMKLLINYVTDYEETSKESMKTFNRRPNSRQFKQTLDTGLAGILNDAQMKEWTMATTSSGGKDKSVKTKKK